MKNYILLLALAANISAMGQLANGSVAPDFTLTDYYGNPHHLYSYLDSGKTVFVEIFAAHCPSCWSYHQTNRLKNMYNMYGPQGSDEIMVLALEHDPYNDSTAFTGNHDPWVTQGDWLTGTPYPIFNVEGADRSVFNDYNVTFYPVIYKICPNKIVERVQTSTTEAQLYQKVKECQALSVTEENILGDIYYNAQTKSVVVEAYTQLKSVAIISMQGVVLKTIHTFNSEQILINNPANGVYLFEFKTNQGSTIKKISVY